MKPQTIALKTMGIKARVFNKYRKLFYKAKKDVFTDVQRIQIFTDFFAEVRDAHNELVMYKLKRQKKAKVEAARVKRGYKSKKKTSLAEYQDRMRHALMSKAS